jgi:hypothetical protein
LAATTAGFSAEVARATKSLDRCSYTVVAALTFVILPAEIVTVTWTVPYRSLMFFPV